MIKLSVIIISLNEERNIRRCLSSVKALADEIMILDSFSTDKTKEIAEGYGARVVQKEFEGYVPARRTVESLAKYDYILAIDADEALSDELHNSIVELKKNWTDDGYFIARRTNYCGKWINHSGWYPDRKLRLYKKGSGYWDGKYVHEKYTLSSNKTIGKLNGDLLHYSYYNESDHWKRTEKYAELSALELFEASRRSSFFHAYFKAAVKFIRVYFFNLGFLDGKKGYAICKITAWGTFKKYALLLGMKKERKTLSVLHISSAISWRGGEQQLSYLQEALEKEGIEQHTLCPHKSKLYKRLSNSGNSNLIGFKKNLLSYPLLAFRIKQLCSQKKIHLIHVHDSHAHSLAFLSAWLFGNKTPIVVHRRVAFQNSQNGFSKLKYNHKSVRKIICVSEAVKEVLSRTIENPNVLEIVHSGVDLSRFQQQTNKQQLRSLLKLKEDSIIIGNTSAIDNHKGYYTFVDTAEIVLKSYPDICFVIIGDGPIKTKIKDYITQKNLTNSFYFTGFRSDVHELLPGFDIFLMTTKTEGLGTSILDAFACEVPVVSTDAGGIPEIIEHHKSGLLAPVGNSELLAQNIIQLLEDKSLRLKIINEATLKLNSFTKEKTVNKIIAIYKALD